MNKSPAVYPPHRERRLRRGADEIPAHRAGVACASRCPAPPRPDRTGQFAVQVGQVLVGVVQGPDGAKVALIGGAAAPFPPIGQGVNAAMESAMALDLAITQAGRAPAQLCNARWKPEADTVSWISERSFFANRFHMLRASASTALGLSIFDQAKSADIPYSEVRPRVRAALAALGVVTGGPRVRG